MGTLCWREARVSRPVWYLLRLSRCLKMKQLPKSNVVNCKITCFLTLFEVEWCFFTQELIQKMDLSELATLHNLLHKEIRGQRSARTPSHATPPELCKAKPKIAHSNLDLKHLLLLYKWTLGRCGICRFPVCKQEEMVFLSAMSDFLQPLQKEDQSDGRNACCFGNRPWNRIGLVLQTHGNKLKRSGHTNG